jgi:hypothetical protein
MTPLCQMPRVYHVTAKIATSDSDAPGQGVEIHHRPGFYVSLYSFNHVERYECVL